jgi:cold shock CspA family protein/energy-coupling factor transporter ATP-binding protein EcfA2
MHLDESFELAKKLISEIEPRLSEIENEQDARFQIINRFLTEVLGWEFGDVKTEPHGPSGYTDYLVSAGGQRRLVIEAKRNGPLLIDTLNPEMRVYKVGGPALASALPGVQQAASYCLDHGVNYALVTTGVVWIAFIPLPGTGTSFKEGLAFSFPNFQAIIENFAVFYDLCSKEGVALKNYNLHFAKAGGLSIAAFEPLTAANRAEYIRLLPLSQLAADLDPVFREFFGSMSGEADREMLIECFVETRESKFADASLEKLIHSISATIAELSPTSDNQLAQEIEAAVESGRGETVLLVGNNGAGKSTFIGRFFSLVLDASVRSRCSVLRVDLLKYTGEQASIANWLTNQLRVGLETSMFEGGIPTYDQLQGLYWRDYQRWMKGQYKPLYDSDKNAFKNKFGDFLNEQMEKDPYSYVLRLLEDIVRNRKLLPCLTFDNVDHFDAKLQEATFQYSQAIHNSIPYTFVVMPVTDRSLWSLSKAGPFQTYPTKMFYLPVPPTKEVLEKRVAYLQRKVDESKDQHSYFLSRGIRLTLENLKGFAACLEEVFIKEDFVSRRISWLANNNLRRCLELTQKLISSPFFSIEQLVTAYITYGASAPLRLNYRAFMQALLHGNYNAFMQDYNLFVLNIFAISPYFPTSPILELSVLKMLIDRAGENTGVGGYISVEQTRQYFIAMGVSEPAIDHAVSVLLGFRLIEPYDASDDTVQAAQRIAVTHSGRIHYEMATIDAFFIGDMAFATPVRSAAIVDELRSIRAAGKMWSDEWRKVQAIFMGYCFEQDALYTRIPKDGIYEGQRQLRFDLKARWIEHRTSETLDAGEKSSPPEILSAENAGLSQVSAVVKWFSSEKGYGFAVAGLSEDVFFHRNTLELSKIDTVDEGDTLVCDIAPGPKGKLQVIAVHSIQKRHATEQSSASVKEFIEGTINFYNSRKGYGFIHVPTLPDDIYFSARILDGSELHELAPGARVRASVSPGRFGKGFTATSIELLE